MSVIDLIAAQPETPDEFVVATLMQDGVGKVDAELLVRLVPCALTFALAKLMGVSSFPSTYCVYNAADQLAELPLAEEHYFTAALGVGYEITTHGYTERISKEVFRHITLRSAEMDAINKFFKAGHSVKDLVGSCLRTPILPGVTAEEIDGSRQSR